MAIFVFHGFDSDGVYIKHKIYYAVPEGNFVDVFHAKYDPDIKRAQSWNKLRKTLIAIHFLFSAIAAAIVIDNLNLLWVVGGVGYLFAVYVIIEHCVRVVSMHTFSRKMKSTLFGRDIIAAIDKLKESKKATIVGRSNSGKYLSEELSSSAWEKILSVLRTEIELANYNGYKIDESKVMSLFEEMLTYGQSNQQLKEIVDRSIFLLNNTELDEVAVSNILGKDMADALSIVCGQIEKESYYEEAVALDEKGD